MNGLASTAKTYSVENWGATGCLTQTRTLTLRERHDKKCKFKQAKHSALYFCLTRYLLELKFKKSKLSARIKPN